MTPLCQGVHAFTELPELYSLQGAHTLLSSLLLQNKEIRKAVSGFHLVSHIMHHSGA